MRRCSRGLACLALAVLCVQPALAQRYEVRREAREGAREVARERAEAARELRRCETRDCARREIREGYREVNREKREARYEIRRELRNDSRYDPYWRDDGRYYRDNRYWSREEYLRRYRDANYRDDRDDLLKGVVIGGAVVGAAWAISNANED